MLKYPLLRPPWDLQSTRLLSYDLLKSSAFLLLPFTWVPWSTMMICSGKCVPLIASFHHSVCLAKTYAVHSQTWEHFRQRKPYNSWNLFPTTQAPDYICEPSVQPQALATVKTSFLPFSLKSFLKQFERAYSVLPGRILSYLFGVCVCSVITLTVWTKFCLEVHLYL